MKLKISYLLLTFGLAVALSACGQKEDGSAENTDSNASADTAVAEIPTETAEQLPDVAQNTDTNTDTNLDANKDTPPSTTTETPPPATDTASTSMSGETESYSVQKGDTLMRIAFNIYGDIMQWKSIYELNKDSIADSSRLVVGTKLKYNKPSSDPMIEKNGEPYLIKKGDTLGTISTEIYGQPTKWKKIWENNKSMIKDPNKIYAGFYLYYQISEEEKQEAEKMKGSQLGSTAPTSAPSQDAPAAAETTGSSTPQPIAPQAAEEGGLQGLLPKTDNGRLPASVNK